jgi:hypothetical protein
MRAAFSPVMIDSPASFPPSIFQKAVVLVNELVSKRRIGL